MVNHYIPQSDGTFRRSPIHEPPRRPAPKPAPPPPPPNPEPAPEPCPPPPPPPCPIPEPPCHAPAPGPLHFLRKLLPKDLDTEDLAVIALLLLLSSREEEDDLAPLLTIALYFLL